MYRNIIFMLLTLCIGPFPFSILTVILSHAHILFNLTNYRRA